MRVDAPEAFKPHSVYISSAHDDYQELRDKLLNASADQLHIENAGETGTEETEEEAKQERDERQISQRYDAAEALAERDMGDDSNGDQPPGSRTFERRELELGLIRQLMDLTVRLEAEARELLLECMEHSIARTLLLADRNGRSGPLRKGFECLLTSQCKFATSRLFEATTPTSCRSGVGSTTSQIHLKYPVRGRTASWPRCDGIAIHLPRFSWSGRSCKGLMDPR